MSHLDIELLESSINLKKANIAEILESLKHLTNQGQIDQIEKAESVLKKIRRLLVSYESFTNAMQHSHQRMQCQRHLEAHRRDIQIMEAELDAERSASGRTVWFDFVGNADLVNFQSPNGSLCTSQGSSSGFVEVSPKGQPGVAKASASPRGDESDAELLPTARVPPKKGSWLRRYIFRI